MQAVSPVGRLWRLSTIDPCPLAPFERSNHGCDRYRLAISWIVLWLLRILAAAFFLYAAVMKLTSQPMMVDDFETFGIGQ